MPKFLLLFSLFFSLSAYAQQPFWKSTSGPAGHSPNFEFNSKGDIFFIGSTYFRSTDDGVTWSDITPPFFSSPVYDWAISANYDLFVTTDTAIFRSTDNGDSWNSVKKVRSSWISASKTGPIYTGSGDILRSFDDGASWSSITSQMPFSTNGYALTILSTGELTFTVDTVYYSSTDNGNSWKQKSILPFRVLQNSGMQSTTNGYLFGGYAQRSTATDVFNGFAIRSTDHGMTWDSINTGNAMVITSNDVLIEFVSPDTIQQSTDYGNTWVNISLPQSAELYNYNYYRNVDQKGNIYWSLHDTIMRYNPASKAIQFLSVPSGSVNSLFVDKKGLITSVGDTYSVSSDGGNRWIKPYQFYDSLYPGEFYSFALDSSGGFISLGFLKYGGFLRSTDEGKSWQAVHKLSGLQIQSSLADHMIVTAPNGNIFICNVDQNIQRSPDLGQTWKAAASGLPAHISSLSCDRSGILYTFIKQSIYRSIDNGDSWQFMINIIDPFLFKNIVATSNISSLVTTLHGEIFVGTTHDGVLVSTDQGVTWNVVNEHLDSAKISALFAAPNGDVYGISKGGSLPDGIIYRPYKGTRWYSANDGLGHTGDLTKMAFALDGTAYLGTAGRGVWRSQGTLNAVHESNEINNFGISISPNPASSHATITYSLPHSDFIKLDLCDALGRTLLNFATGNQDAGEHSVNGELNDLADGIYFVRLVTSDGTATKKILLTK